MRTVLLLSDREGSADRPKGMPEGPAVPTARGMSAMLCSDPSDEATRDRPHKAARNLMMMMVSIFLNV